jgi:hypothetical protein
MLMAQIHCCQILGFNLIFICRPGISAIDWTINWMEMMTEVGSMTYIQYKRTFATRNNFQLLVDVAKLFPNTIFLRRVYGNCPGVTFLTKCVGLPPPVSNDEEYLPSS